MEQSEATKPAEQTQAPAQQPVQQSAQQAEAPKADTPQIDLALWDDVKKQDAASTNTKDEVANDFAQANADTTKPVQAKKHHTLDEYKSFALMAHFAVDELYDMLTNAFKFKWAEIDHKGGLQINNKDKFDHLVKTLAELLYIEQVEIPKILKWFFYGAGVFMSYKHLFDDQVKDFEKLVNKDKKAQAEMSLWVNEKLSTQDSKPENKNNQTTKAA